MDLIDKLDQVKSIIELELNSFKKMEGNVLEVFKSYFSIVSDLQPEIHYTSSCLVFTDKQIYDQFRSKITDLEEVLSIELQDYNIYVYLCRYHNIKPIAGLLQ